MRLWVVTNVLKWPSFMCGDSDAKDASICMGFLPLFYFPAQTVCYKLQQVKKYHTKNRCHSGLNKMAEITQVTSYQYRETETRTWRSQHYKYLADSSPVLHGLWISPFWRRVFTAIQATTCNTIPASTNDDNYTIIKCCCQHNPAACMTEQVLRRL